MGPLRRRLREALAGPTAALGPPAPERVRRAEAATSPAGGFFSGMKRLSLANIAEAPQLAGWRRLRGPNGPSRLSRAHLRGVDGVVPCVEAAAKPPSHGTGPLPRLVQSRAAVLARSPGGTVLP